MNWIKKILKMYRKKDNLKKQARELRVSLPKDANNPDLIIDHLLVYPQFWLSQQRSEIRHLMNLVHEHDMKRICEIGTYKGGSLYCLTQAAPAGATILSIDIEYPVSRKFAHREFAKTGQRIVCIEGDTKDPKTFSKAALALSGEKLDFLFIDGDHEFAGVVNDYARYSPLVKKGGIIAIHDIHPINPLVKDTKAYVGQVPAFWNAIKQAGFSTEEVIEDPNQDGKGIGIIYL